MKSSRVASREVFEVPAEWFIRHTIVFVLSVRLVASCAFAQTAPEIHIGRQDVGLQVTFTGRLQTAAAVTGPWADMADAVTPYTIATVKSAGFFRSVAVTNSTPTNTLMRIRIGSRTFIATLYDNAAATAFKALLPMTVNMHELNGNEKYVYLSSNLPTDAAKPGTIQSGDLLIYGSNCLVLFYETFATSYSYTRLGRINDTSGLANSVGSGGVTVTYELE